MAIVTKQITLDITYNSDEMNNPMDWWWPDLLSDFYQVERVGSDDPERDLGIIRLVQINIDGEQ